MEKGMALNALGEKTGEPLTAATFDSHSERLGIAMGLSEKLSQYCYRRGSAETVNSEFSVHMHTYK